MPVSLINAMPRYAPAGLLFTVILAISALMPQVAELQNVNQVLRQTAVPAILAIGVTFVVITGKLDLSVGSILSCSALATIEVSNSVGTAPAIAAALAIGVAVGSLNGLLVAYLGLNSLIATLGMLSVIQGIALVHTDGANIVMNDLEAATWFSFLARGSVLGIPFPAIIVSLLAVVAGVLLHTTTFGRRVFAVGGNAVASAYSSIDTRKTVFLGYILSGGMAGLGGVVYASGVMTARHDSGVGLELTVLSAVILGGASLTGGSGSVFRSLVGVMIIGVMQSALLMLGLPFYTQWIAVAVILIVAAWLNVISSKGGMPG